jgi:hypothetical protein
MKALSDNPFSSVRELSRLTRLSRSTVHQHLLESLGLTVRLLHWVPIVWRTIRRRSGSTCLESYCKCFKHNRPTRGTTLWVWMSHGFISRRTTSGSGSHQGNRCLTESDIRSSLQNWWSQSLRIPVRSMWWGTLPKGTKFNAGYYITEILQRINDWRGNQGVHRVRRLVVQADNVRPHTANLSISFMEVNMMTKAPHPPDSPDLAPSDFFYLLRWTAGSVDVPLTMPMNFLGRFIIFWRSSRRRG